MGRPVAACPSSLDDWEVSQGDLQAGRTCGSYVAATNGATIAYSFGQVTWKAEVSAPYRVSVTWRRLGSDTRSLELHLLGGVVILGDDKIGLWIDDPSFEIDGFHELKGYRTRAIHRVSAVQRADAIEVEVDGVMVARWALRAPTAAAQISVAFKGQRGAREKIWFKDFAVDQLQASSARPK